MARKNLGEVLLEMGAIDRQQLQAAQHHMQQWDVPLHQALVERKFCALDDIVRAFSIQTGYPVINLDLENLDLRMADVLPQKQAEQWRVVPLKLGGRRYEVLELAVAVPADLSTVDSVLALTKKSRAVVHIANDHAIERALGRLYRGGAMPQGHAAQQARVAERPVDVQNEETFELAEDRPDVAKPVLLYGFHPAALKAVAMMLDRGGVTSAPLDDDGLEKVQPDELIISTTLALRVAIPTGKVRAKLIVCGTAEAGDAEDARALGAKLYLKPPLSTEQLVRAIQHVIRPK